MRQNLFVLSQMVEIVKKYSFLETQNEVAREYIFQGVIRRLNIMKTCIKNLFSILPLDMENHLHSTDATEPDFLNLHSTDATEPTYTVDISFDIL